ncbi:unnamed protein product, partial [marine sediment metagenome]
MFGGSMFMLGYEEDVNRANALELEKNYLLNTIQPRTKLRDITISNKIMPLYDRGLYVKSQVIVPQDKDFNLKQEDQDLRNAVVVVNEVREKRGLEPRPWGDVPILPYNVMPFGSAPEKEKGKEKIYSKAEEKAIIEEWKIVYWKAYVRKTINQERLIKSKLSPYFDTQESLVLRNLKKYSKDYKMSELFLFPMAEANEELAIILSPLLQQFIEEAAETFIDDFGIGISFDTKNPFIDDFFKGRKIKMEGINNTTYDALKKTLEEGIQNGETIKELSGRVEHVYKEARGSRSFKIARTEVNTANNFSHFEVMRQAQIEKKEWIT